MTVSGVAAIGLWVGLATSVSAFVIESGSEIDVQVNRHLQNQLPASEAQLSSGISANADADLSLNLQENKGAVTVNQQTQAGLEGKTKGIVNIGGTAKTEESAKIKGNATGSLGDADTRVEADANSGTTVETSTNVSGTAEGAAIVYTNGSAALTCTKEEPNGSTDVAASGTANANLSLDEAELNGKTSIDSSTQISFAENQTELQANAELSATSELELNAFQQFLIYLSNVLGIGLQIYLN